MTRLTEAEYAELTRSNPDISWPMAVQRRAPRAPCPSEHEEQVALFRWVDANEGRWPELRTMFAIPNGGARDALTGAMLKQEGVRSGIPDIFLPAMRSDGDGRMYGGLFLELKKSDHTNNASPSQKAWIDMLRSAGYMVAIAYGCAEAIRIITTYLGGNGRENAG